MGPPSVAPRADRSPIAIGYRAARWFRAIWLLLAALSLSADPAGAGVGTAGFEPPASGEFDWIQVDSDEWLKGEIVAMYKETLQFDSDKLGELTFDFADVRRIRSAGPMQVGLLGGGVAVGRLIVDGSAVRVVGEGERTFERPQIFSITPGVSGRRDYWSGRVSAGANLRRGNTEQLETNARVSLRRRTVKSRLNLDWLANFSEGEGTTIADNQSATLRWDRFASDRVFLSPLIGEYYRDPFQNVSHRWTVGAGAGYQIVDSPKVDWLASAGIAYQGTRFDDVPGGEADSDTTLAFVAGTTYERALRESVDLALEYRFFVIDEESGRYTHHAAIELEFDLVGSLGFDVTFVWDRIEKPRRTSGGTLPEQDDYRLNLGLGFDF